MINKEAFQWKSNLKDNYWQYLKRGWGGGSFTRLFSTIKYDKITKQGNQYSHFTLHGNEHESEKDVLF